jgi:hypothetical protein
MLLNFVLCSLYLVRLCPKNSSAGPGQAEARPLGRAQIEILAETRALANARASAWDSALSPLTLYKEQSSKQKSRAKQRGTSLVLKFFGSILLGLPELFSRLFCVAASRLNSPRFPVVLIRRASLRCQAGLPSVAQAGTSQVFFSIL